MASNLRRLLPSPAVISKPKLGLGFLSDISASSAAGVRRSLSTSNKQDTGDPQSKEVEVPPPEIDGKKDKAKVEKDVGEDGPYVNPKTGEVGGPRGPEPTRYSDWEVKGRCSDF